MLDYILAVLPGILTGVLSALGSLAAVKAVLKGLIYRVAMLEKIAMENQRALGRLEGHREENEVHKCSY
jgi:hypothetical protein